MRRRRQSAESGPCCRCDCGLCGLSTSFCARSNLLRPTCIFRCRIADTCSFQTESIPEYERHLWNDHKELVTSEKCFQTTDDEEVQNPFVPQVAIKVEPGAVYNNDSGSNLNKKIGRKRKRRKERYKEEEDLVYDDEEDEDYDITDEYYQDYGDYGDYKGFKEEYYDDYEEEEEEKEISHVCGYAGCEFGAESQAALTAHEAQAHLKWVKRAFEANSALFEAMVSWGGDDGRWGCLKCGKKLSAAKVAATAHACQDHGEEVEAVKCVDCEFSCKHPRDMRDHFKTAHLSKDTPRTRGVKKDLNHRCGQCGHEAASRRQLLAHEMSEHGGRAPSYSSRQCEHCDFIALNRRSLTAHRAEAHPELAEPILCHLCGFATETKSKLQRHVAAKHGNYQCEQCDFSTPLHRKLVQHVKNIHREICEVCCLPINDGESMADGSHACPAILGKGKPDPNELFRIIRIKSTSRKIGLLRDSDGGGYVCLDCGASYRVMLVMRRHVVMMHGSHVCGECEFVGESRPELDRHMAERHPLVCKKCGMEAEDGQHLEVHACSMTPNVSADPTGMNPAKTKRNRLRLTTCDIPGCQIVFADRKMLRQHRKDAHGREAQVPCEVCGKYFANNTKLRLHVKTQHEGVKDMCCPFCAYATGDSGNFVKHVRKSHPERGPECPYAPCQFRAASMPALSRHVASEHRVGNKVEPEDSMQH